LIKPDVLLLVEHQMRVLGHLGTHERDLLVVFDTTFQVLINMANGDEAPRLNTIDSVDVLP
jgi:hypothetical protein